jgi:hypothetical protein
MSFRVIGTGITFAVLSSFWSMPVVAQQDPTLPQNFRVSELREGPGRFQVALVYEWEQAKKRGTNDPATIYQLNKACGYTFSGQDKAIGGNSGLLIMSGPGPHYRVQAVCNCARYTWIAPAVRVYNPPGKWVTVANPPSGQTKPGGWFVAPCSPNNRR